MPLLQLFRAKYSVAQGRDLAAERRQLAIEALFELHTQAFLKLLAESIHPR